MAKPNNEKNLIQLQRELLIHNIPKLEVQDIANLIIDKNAHLAYKENNEKNHNEVLQFTNELQLDNSHKRGEIELIFGLDFGTSSSKVVIYNASIDKSYAIEFNSPLKGYKKFLASSTLYQSGESFFLNKGDIKFNNLKLNFLDNYEDINNQIRIVAYLALIMSRSRNYLFENFKNELIGSKILWQINAGYAGRDLQNSNIAKLYKKLLKIAWYFSTQLKFLKYKNIKTEIGQSEHQNYPEIHITVVPEIIAQVYAYAVSNKFDKQAKNHYMIVDIGAGTVDTAVFNIQNNNGAWDFSLFMYTIERNGVTELHRSRINWWLMQLLANNANIDLIKEIKNLPLDTNQLEAYPNNYINYFIGVTNNNDSNKNPDLSFFNKKILNQVKINTMYHAFTTGQLVQNEIKNMPFYLCGGGSRMDIYKKLKKQLTIGEHGFKWLTANYLELTKPEKLEAKNLEVVDYDRLSVAYGLSNMYIGKINNPDELEKKNLNLRNTMNDFISKDLV